MQPPSRAYPSDFQAVRGYFTQLARRLRRLAGLHVLLLALLGAAALILLGPAAATLKHLFPWAPLFYAGLGLLLAGAFLVQAFRWLLRHWRAEDLALRLEQLYPGLRNDAISSLQLEAYTQPAPEEAGSAAAPARPADGEAEPRAGRRGAARRGSVSTSLIHALQRATRRKLEAIDAQVLVPIRNLKWLSVACALGLAALLVTLAMQPQTLRLATEHLFHPLASMPPRHFTITMEPGDRQVARGQAVTLTAQAHERQPASMRLALRFADGSRREMVMQAAAASGADAAAIDPQRGGRFTHTLARVQQSFRYRAASGVSQSEEHAITAVDPPHLGNVRVSYVFPKYTGLAPKAEVPSGHIQALVGSEITIHFDADKELQNGKLAFDDGSEVLLEVQREAQASDRPANEAKAPAVDSFRGMSVTGVFILTRSGTYRAEVTDTLGFRNPEPVVYSMKAVPDASPQVEILEPATDLVVDEGQNLNLVFLARDDFGISQATLVYHKGNKEAQRLPVETLRERKTLYKSSYTWSLAGLGLEAGEEITYFLEVEDNDIISGPKKGVSKTYRLTLRSREAVHEEAQKSQEEITNELLDLLAEQLEMQADTEKLATQALPRSLDEAEPYRNLLERDARLQERVDRLSQKVSEAQQRIQQDPLNNYGAYLDMNTLRQNLQYLRQTLQPQASKALEGLSSREPPPSPSSEPQGLPEELQRRASRPDARAGSPPQPERRSDQAFESRLNDLLSQQEQVTSEIERLSSFSEEMQQRQQMSDLGNLGKQLTNLQNRLLDRLDAMQKGMDAAARGALEKELQQVQDLMAKLSEALRKLPSQLPDEFLNQANVKELGLDQIQQGLDEVRRKLAEGDLEGARQALERMMQKLSQMLAMLQNAQQMAERNAMGGMQNSAQRSSSEMEEIIKEQGDILQLTQAVEKALAGRLMEAQKEALERLVPKTKAQLEALRNINRNAWRDSTLDPSLQIWSFDQFNAVDKAVTSMKESLDNRRIAEFAEQARAALEEFEQLGRAAEAEPRPPLRDDPLEPMRRRASVAQRTLKEILQALEGLEVSPRRLLSEAELQALEKLTGREGDLRERTERFHERLREIAKLLPFLPQEVVDQIGAAVPNMAAATKELSHQRPRQAAVQETEALRHLLQSQQSLQQALQQMAQRGTMGGMAMPLILQSRAQPLLPGMPNMPPMQPGQLQEGVMGVNRENFRLPQAGEYQVPKVFREEIMEALKEGVPESFREQVEQYYQNLVE
ncbi:MAG: hypothetical protein HYY96_05540 [Candidatus Tectomicrobia bacterium]|nr:hypothetical protein [Candidatus Tectomicrobia bacterium]